MRRFAIALGIGALLISSKGVGAADFTWDFGAGDAYWDSCNTGNDNWGDTCTSDFWPGKANNADTAQIVRVGVMSAVIVNRDITFELKWVEVNATAGAMQLTINDADADIAVDEYIKLVGGNGAGERAEFQYDEGAVAVTGKFDMVGGNRAGKRAELDMNVSLDLSATTDVNLKGFCRIDLASDVVFEVYDVDMVDAATDFTVFGANNVSELRMDSFTNDLKGKITYGPNIIVEVY